MGNVLRSIDDQIANVQTNGALLRVFHSQNNNTTTTANTTSGYFTMSKYPEALTIPSFGGSVTGAYCSRLDMTSDDGSTVLYAAYATDLGNINMNTGTFTDGSAMPTRTVKGSSVTTAAQMVVAVVTTAVTATTPVLTITYTDQDGNTGNTATLTLPTSPALTTTFRVDPHLATGDTGIRDITGVTKSAGTAGVITFYGLHVIKTQYSAGTGLNSMPPSGYGIVPWIASGGDKIHFYRVGATTTTGIIAQITLLPD